LRQPPPPVAQIGRKAFRQMSDTELLAWVARVYADWRELPTALLELSDRHVHYRARAGAAAQGAGLRVRGLAAGPDGDLVDVELTVTDPATVAKLTPRGGCGYSFGFAATGAPTATFTVPDPDAVARVHASLDALFAAGRERGEIR
jgi:hypothetical protein